MFAFQRQSTEIRGAPFHLAIFGGRVVLRPEIKCLRVSAAQVKWKGMNALGYESEDWEFERGSKKPEIDAPI